MKNKRLIKGIIGVAGAITLSIVIYQFAYSQTYKTPFFSSANDTGVISQMISKVTNQPALTTETAAQFDTQGITIDTLATYNGTNGQPAYVGFEGIVYDVSALANWKSGSHHGVNAGTDITDVFAQSPHSKSILKLAVVVGKLVPNVIVVDQNNSQNSTASNNALSTDPSAQSATIEVVSGASEQTLDTQPSDLVAVSNTTQVNSSKLGSTTTTAKIWNYDLLSQYNGKNGQPAYIAVDGVIYDVTALGSWSTGTHHGVTAGKDVTADFAASPHSQSILQQAIIIGRIDYPVDQNVVVTNPIKQTLTNDEDSDDDNEDDDDDDDDNDRDNESKSEDQEDDGDDD